jgi:hypothetical protein
MIRIALLSNPRSTGNRSLLPRVRSFCAHHPEIFHYEVERVDQIDTALRTIARVEPRVLVINGGDGTVQATLTELYHGGQFQGTPPPVAVLPNGKTNLIALDLGAAGDPIQALERVLEIARGDDLTDHIVTRELIALTHEVDGVGDGLKPVLGMFLGGAGLTEVMLYCRNKIYPLGLPNWLSHVLTAMALLVSLVLGIRAAFLPDRPAPVKVSLIRQGAIQGSFSLLMVTTLKKLLIGSRIANQPAGSLQLMAIDQNPVALIRALVAGLFGRLGSGIVNGVHIRRGDEIRIEGDRSSVILDGEIFEAGAGSSIVLRPTAPLPFLRLAA